MFLINWGKIKGRIDPSSFRKFAVFHSDRFSIQPMGEVIEINPRISFLGLDKDTDISFVPMERIDEAFGSIKEINTKKIRDSIGFTRFNNGDLLWAKITPCMQNGKSAVAKNLVNNLGCGSTEFFVIRPKNNKILIEYIHFLLRDERVLSFAQNYFGGAAGQQRVSKDFLLYLPIPIPDIGTQQRIISIMNEAYNQKRKKLQESKDLLNNINDYLLDVLTISLPLEKECDLHNRIFYINANDMISGRFDPRKYSLKYKQLLDAIKSAPYDRLLLKEIVLNDVSGDWGMDDAAEDSDLISCLTIRGTEFDNKFNLDLDNNRTKFRKYSRASFNKIALKEKDILIEKSGGSEEQPVGRVAFIEKDMLDNYPLAFSNFIHRIRIDENKAVSEYVFEYLRLMHNIKITEVMQTQTNGIRNLIMQEYFTQTILLPELKKQEDIAIHAAGMRRRAFELQMEAENVITDAKIKVEKILLGDEHKVKPKLKDILDDVALGEL